ncbi:MAG: universal stress protein [Archaeoglobaceae archaeon]|nr:universal stress protein [Archaeoglobaceae archaeon]MDW8128623.1 universal stress protein [Archaeoglobaceae archaeon]
MVKLEKMLFPTDFSPYSMIVTEFLEDLKNAGVKEIGILFIVNTARLSSVSGGFDLGRYVELEEKRAEEELPKILERIEKAGMKAKVVKPFPSGDPVNEIVKSSKSYDFISIGARGRGIFKEILLGSVSEGVLRRSDIPVYVFKSRTEILESGVKCYKPCEDLFARILVAYDFSKHSQKCLEYATEIAKRTRGEMILLYVEEDGKDKKDNLKAVAEDLRAKGISVIDIKASGSPVKVILSKQAEMKATTVFLGSRGLSLPRSLIGGSVSDPVVRAVEVPVFVSKGPKE